LCWLAVGRAASESAQAGMEVLDEAVERISRGGEELFLPVVHLARARLLDQSGDTAQTAASFRAALQVAHVQGAKALELRAATELAELHCRNGRTDATCAHLRQLVDEFPEDTGSVELLHATETLRRAAELA